MDESKTENMQQYLRPAAFIGAVVILLGAALYLYPTGMGMKRGSTNATTTNPFASSTIKSASSTKPASSASIKPTATSGNVWGPGSSMPSLKRPVKFGSMVVGEAQAKVNEKIELQRAVLINGVDTDDQVKNAWLNLALFYTYARDFGAAIEVWEYLVRVLPRDVDAYNYLGNAYRNDLQDFPSAEKYYLDSLDINPNQPGIYSELFYMYSLQYKTDTASAENILNRAIKQFPNDPSFPDALAKYKAGTK